MDDRQRPPSPLNALPEWLEAGLAQAGSEVMIVAQRAYRLRAVGVDQPLLVLPLEGTKRVRHEDHRSDILPGQYLLIQQALSLEVENLPESEGRPYRAWAISFPWRIVALARALLAAHAQLGARRDAGTALAAGAVAPLLPALRDLLAALSASDAVLIDHALLGLALALARDGQEQFLHASDPSLSARIRLLAAEAPARAWVSADFEARLHVSGATLRRRLAEERTSLRALLREVRLHHGLALLQTGRRPLKSVALACGYRSVPSFSRNFSAHFGVAPTLVACRAD